MYGDVCDMNLKVNVCVWAGEGGIVHEVRYVIIVHEDG
jgi:hypothetical protein